MVCFDPKGVNLLINWIASPLQLVNGRSRVGQSGNMLSYRWNDLQPLLRLAAIRAPTGAGPGPRVNLDRERSHGTLSSHMQTRDRQINRRDTGAET